MANTVHGVLIQSSVISKNVDALNRRAKGTVDLDNGNIVNLNGVSTVAGEGEVWNAIAPTSATTVNLWMVSEPEVVMTAGKYKGLDPDPRNFYVASGDVFSISKLKKNDVIRLTDANFSNASTVGTFVNVTSGSTQLTWAATSSVATVGQLVTTQPLAIPTGTPGNNRVTTYKIEIIAE